MLFHPAKSNILFHEAATCRQAWLSLYCMCSYMFSIMSTDSVVTAATCCVLGKLLSNAGRNATERNGSHTSKRSLTTRVSGSAS